MKIASIPFDQYSRQRIAQQIVDDVLRPSIAKSRGRPDQRLTILDVGGYMGKTAEFFPKDSVNVLDVFDIDEPGYIKGDATALDVPEDAYDLICSFDVLEHIPRDQRQAFIAESARVSQTGFFIAAPMDDSHRTVSYAETTANEIFKTVNGQDHRWLEEHIEYGLPTNHDTEQIIKRLGLNFTKAQSNPVAAWLTMQSGFFLKSALENKHNFLHREHIKDFLQLHETMNGFYNDKCDILEAQGHQTAYRSVYFVSHDAQLVQAVRDYLDDKINARASQARAIEQTTLELQAVSGLAVAKAIQLILQRGARLEKELQASQGQNHQLSTQLAGSQENLVIINNKLQAVLASKSWRLTKPLRDLVTVFKAAKQRIIG